MSEDDDAKRAIEELWRELGLSPEQTAHRTIFAEATELVPIGKDCFERGAFLAPVAADAWRRMRAAAAADGMRLLLVSAFRSHDYQARLFARKIQRGLALAEIMRVVTLPGCSQHHTGRAIDVAAPGFERLVEEFETTPEFRWLEENARRFGFVLSYPRGNPHGVGYEPWHWFFEAAPNNTPRPFGPPLSRGD